MRIIDNTESLKAIIKRYKNNGSKLSLIPTMGNLHNGHLTLIDKAPEDTVKIVTIYVNPLQFDNHDDYECYPSTFKDDVENCSKKNVDIIFAPKLNISDEFDNNKNIDLPKFTRYLCGASRANHFSGVYKIVKYLFSIIEPDFACFGKKDYQQLLLIKYIAKTYFPNLQIIDVDVVRENNIALSSRLNRLGKESLAKYANIYNVLISMRKSLREGEKFYKLRDYCIKKIESLEISVEYLDHRKNDTLEPAGEILDGSSLFIACYINKVRLIDNIQI